MQYYHDLTRIRVQIVSLAKLFGSFALVSTILLTGATGLVNAADKERRKAVECAAKTGGEFTSFASCMAISLTAAEIPKLGTDKFFGCGNELRKIFNPCRSSGPPKPAFMIPYKRGFVLIYGDGNSHDGYYSPDGQNLRGGGNTIQNYDGRQYVLAMVPYRNRVWTAFSGGGIYRSSPHAQQLSPADGLLYNAGAKVRSMRVVNRKLETCFVRARCYCSRDGLHPGGGPGTINGRCN